MASAISPYSQGRQPCRTFQVTGEHESPEDRGSDFPWIVVTVVVVLVIAGLVLAATLSR